MFLLICEPCLPKQNCERQYVVVKPLLFNTVLIGYQSQPKFKI